MAPVPKQSTLKLLSRLTPDKENIHAHLSERDINREKLLDISPDREDLLRSDKTVEELRQALKIKAISVSGAGEDSSYVMPPNLASANHS